MKTRFKTLLTKIILPAAILFVAVGCENEDDGPLFTVQEPSETVGFTNTFLGEYLLSPQTKDNIAERLLWNTPSFGGTTAVNFKVEGSNTNEFNTTDVGYFVADNLNATNYAVSVESLLKVATALDLNGDPTSGKEASGTAYLRVTASVGDPTNSNGFSTVSEVKEITITMVEVVSQDESIPMLAVAGAYQGWSPGDAPLLAASESGKTDFEGFIHMTAGEFKFVEADDDGVYDWGNTDWGQSKTEANGILDEADEKNVEVSTDGLYYLQVETGLGTYSTTLVNFGVIGEATPTGWSSDTKMTYDATNNVMSLDINLTSGKEYKIRANDDWGLDFPLQMGPDSDGDGLLDTKDGNFTHSGDTGMHRVTLDVSTARKYTLTVTKL
ncbi:MAG: SusE domain-containing protein [Flavobacteriaceae bacterium]|jgi:hypothetical protein|nr:SusE domain-containing protein [Flavobacteriaceae bacterium]